jgi:hypothetical protein
MATGRKLVSDIRGMHKILSTDALITDRVILSEIKTQSLLLIKRETNLRKLWATDTLFTTIPCLEMIEVPISECCSYVDPCSIARTRFKLPKISEGNYQYVIQGVYSIDAMSGTGNKLKEITVNRYINLLKLPIIKNQHYYWITNEYLYVSSPLVQAVRLVAFFEEDVPNEIMYPECGCGDITNSLENICTNPLDRDVHIPGYLIKQVLSEVSNKLLQTYFQLKTDLSSDGLDGQAPNTK